MINQEKINLAAQSSLKLRRDTRAEPKFEADIIDDFESPTSPYQATSRQPSPLILKTLFNILSRYFSKDGLPAEALAKAGGGGGSRTGGNVKY